jgi:hypothetical protein
MNKNNLITFNLLLLIVAACFCISCSSDDGDNNEEEPERQFFMKDSINIPAQGGVDTLTFGGSFMFWKISIKDETYNNADFYSRCVDYKCDPIQVYFYGGWFKATFCSRDFKKYQNEKMIIALEPNNGQKRSFTFYFNMVDADNGSYVIVTQDGK